MPMLTRLSFALLFVGHLALLSSAAPEPVAPRAPSLPQPGISLRADEQPDAATRALVDLLTADTGDLKDKAFAKGEYKTLRTAFARYVEAKHGDEMKSALGDDADPLFAWLDKNPDLKET